MQNFLERLKEPSSWAGFGVIASLFFHVPVTKIEVVQQAVAGIFAAVAVLKSEKK